MKKSKLKSLVNTARKSAEKDMKSNIAAALKEIAAQYGEGSKSLEKRIKKGSKQLAKELSKLIKVDKSVLIDSSAQQEETSQGS
jgi:translation initiation factor 2 alpha subunit (eIF-2alpha)